MTAIRRRTIIDRAGIADAPAHFQATVRHALRSPPPVPLAHVLYVSRCSDGLSETQVFHIGRQAERRNWKAGITGALLYTGHHFVQWFEGPPPAVERLLDRVALDPRHRDVAILSQGPIPARRFDQWGMRTGRHLQLGDRLEGLGADGLQQPAVLAECRAWVIEALRNAGVEDIDPFRPTGWSA